MKRPIQALLVVAGIAGAALAPLASAASPEGSGCGHGLRNQGFHGYGTDADRRIDFMVESLGLSTAQRDALRAISDKARPQQRELHDKLAENRKQLRDLMQQSTPKESEMRKLADTQGRLISDLMVLRMKERTEMRNVLTPEQQDRLQHRHEWHGQPSALEGADSHRSLSTVSM